MSAPEATVAVPVEEVKPADATPAVDSYVEPKVDEPAAVVEVVTPAVEAEAPATDVEPAPTEEPYKEDTKPVEGDSKKESGPKSPNFLSNLLGSLTIGKFKGEKRTKAPKSPKKEKKKEEAEPPAVEEAPKDVPVYEAPVEAPEPVKEETPEPVKETETAAVPAVQYTAAEEAPEVKEEKPTAPKGLKVGRRLSARVGDFFKPKPKPEVTPPAKVDEHPPKIDEPEPVAPLENPASDSKAEESAKPADVAVPVVAAAA